MTPTVYVFIGFAFVMGMVAGIALGTEDRTYKSRVAETPDEDPRCRDE